uniref:Membrane-associated kinase regulator 1 n=1 Tax=Cajanus cajan TaxID=3821 RepID=A0A151TK31_CAJCA|nr:hypothetical protein KK1_013684 [Cajanus cajan]
MVRTLLLSSSSTSSSATSTAARDSTGSSSNDSHSSFTTDLALFPDCDSSRPSSATDDALDDDLKRLHNNPSTKKPNKGVGALSHSFSGNLRYPRRRSCVSSCPSSMRSSPNHSGVLSQKVYCGDTSSMEELQSAIQGAIAHCKNSLIQNKTMVSNEI